MPPRRSRFVRVASTCALLGAAGQSPATPGGHGAHTPHVSLLPHATNAPMSLAAGAPIFGLVLPRHDGAVGSHHQAGTATIASPKVVTTSAAVTSSSATRIALSPSAAPRIPSPTGTTTTPSSVAPRPVHGELSADQVGKLMDQLDRRSNRDDAPTAPAGSTNPGAALIDIVL